jgi:hypothetical protein
MISSSGPNFSSSLHQKEKETYYSKLPDGENGLGIEGRKSETVEK